MSQIYSSSTSVSPAPSGAVQAVKTDDQGVLVKPDGAGNISVVGGSGINVNRTGTSEATISASGDARAVGQVDVDKGGMIRPNSEGVIDVKGGAGIEVRKTSDNGVTIVETGGGKDVSSLGTPQGEVYPTPDGKITIKGAGRAEISGDAETNSVTVDVPASGDSFLTDTLPMTPVLPDAQGRVKLQGGTDMRTAGNPGTNSVVFDFTGRFVKQIGAEAGTAAVPTVGTGEIWIFGENGIDTWANGSNNSITLRSDAVRNLNVATGKVNPDNAGGITFVGESGISIFPRNNELIFSSTGEGTFVWQVAGAGRALLRRRGFISTNASNQNFPLPNTAAVGDVFELAQSGAGNVRITQGNNQQVRFGNQLSTKGAAGFWESRMVGAVIKLVCVEANVLFLVIASIGNWIRG